jgi:hypothetical protein
MTAGAKNYTVRTMTRAEVDLAVEWAAREGWNPGLNDAECYSAADPNGFFVGLLGQEPIATISAVKYGPSFGFIGFYIVKAEYRHRGYGLRIWNAALEYLDGCTVGLDGVVAQQGNYSKSGFELAYRNIRYAGTTSASPCSGSAELVDLGDLPFDDVASFGVPFFPADRTRFDKCWIAQPGAFAIGVRQDEALVGYGVIRPCRTGYKVGPLFAPNAELAKHLFLALNSRVDPGQPVFLDVPDVNPAAVALAESFHMKPAFETARMYKGGIPDQPLDRIFGVTSFEIG